MSYTIRKDWHAFSVSLQDVDAKLRTDYPADADPDVFQYHGNQAHSHLEFVFSKAPDGTQQTAIDSYWDDMTAGSDEAVNYVSSVDLKAGMERAKDDAASKDWTTAALTTEQRKMILGQDMTHAECLQVLTDFPEV